MSLQALADALRADVDPTKRLVLIYLANEADADDVVVPYLDRLARKVGISRAELLEILTELHGAGVVAPVSEHPFDFFAGTEGFRLHIDELPRIPDMPESPWAKELRRVPPGKRAH